MTDQSQASIRENSEPLADILCLTAIALMEDLIGHVVAAPAKDREERRKHLADFAQTAAAIAKLFAAAEIMGRHEYEE